MKDRIPRVLHGDSRSGGAGHTYVKKRKARAERRRAKARPDCLPAYGRYKGYLS